MTGIQMFIYSSAEITYSITPSTTSVNEGSSVTFTVTTTNFGSGTLYWTLETIPFGMTYLNNADFSSPANAVTAGGSVSITANSGSFVLTLSNDATTEGAEQFRARLRTGSTSGTGVALSSTITINDTSSTPPPPPPPPPPVTPPPVTPPPVTPPPVTPPPVTPPPVTPPPVTPPPPLDCSTAFCGNDPSGLCCFYSGGVCQFC